MGEIFVPKEKVVSVVVTNGTKHSFVLAFSYAHHLVNRKRVSFFVPGLDDSSRTHLRDFLANIGHFHEYLLALVVNNFDLFLINLKHETKILA